jgi:hypothetical protein
MSFAQSLDTLDTLALLDYPQLLKKEGVTETDINRIEQLFKHAEQLKKEAQLELNINQAQLEKLLFNIDVDTKEVERVLQISHKWRLKAELAQIDLYVKVRQILGKDKWTNLIRNLKHFIKQRMDDGSREKKSTDKPLPFKRNPLNPE